MSRSRAIVDRDEELGLERKIGNTNDILSVEFFEAGLLAAKSVGRFNILFVTVIVCPLVLPHFRNFR